jgi:hypothetical protein
MSKPIIFIIQPIDCFAEIDIIVQRQGLFKIEEMTAKIFLKNAHYQLSPSNLSWRGTIEKN